MQPTDSESLICGHPFSAIQRAQQGGNIHAPLPPLDAEKHKNQIISDVQRFHLPVSDSVKQAYGLELPGYTLNGDTWTFAE